MKKYALRAFGSTITYTPSAPSSTRTSKFVPRNQEAPAIRGIGISENIPVTSVSFPYVMNGVTLEAPDMATAPLLQGGQVIYGQAFTLFWYTLPSVATQNALTNGAIGHMVFPAHDGAKMTTTVKVESGSSNGAFLATMTIMVSASVDRFAS